MTDEPFEPEEGQESEPPNVGLALLVAIHLLLDLRDYLESRRELLTAGTTFIRREHPREDLMLRIAPVVAVLRRAREVADGYDA